jgi:hypothetical protein
MNEPLDLVEYKERYKQNARMSGQGLNVMMFDPCPFCAAPDFWVYRIMDVVQVVSQEHVCEHCARGARVIVTRTPSSVHFVVEQTQGPDQPDWLIPKVRRAGAGDNHAG